MLVTQLAESLIFTELRINGLATPFLVAESTMENQHAMIKGYRDLSEEEIKAMNAVKQKAEEVGVLVREMEANKSLDQRWVAIAKTDLQRGFMAAVRAIAQPTTFG
jgi:hypothetical protein